MNNGKYTIKNVKTITGREGHGYSCTLYLDSKKIGTIIDDASGCEVEFNLKDDNYSLLKEFSETQNECPETLLGSMVDDFVNTKRFKKLCKTKTLFRIKGDEIDSFRTITNTFDVRVKAYLVSKYGDEIEEIVNERYL